jgi:uridine phosphorylase
VPFEVGRTWTTDGLFRETRAKVARRRDEGCLTVEMEAAALFAVAAFRGVTIGQLLYCGDDLSTEAWDHRGWDGDTGVRERLFEIACAAVGRL